jgi:hypothetical protein
MTQDRYIFEEPPHVYAIAEDAYRSLLTEGVNQCIIIRHGSIIITITTIIFACASSSSQARVTDDDGSLDVWPHTQW